MAEIILEILGQKGIVSILLFPYLLIIYLIYNVGQYLKVLKSINSKLNTLSSLFLIFMKNNGELDRLKENLEDDLEGKEDVI